MATLLTAGMTLPFYNEMALAQLSRVGPLPPDAVKINANENPLGPCPEAAEAMAKVIARGGRYMYEETDTFAKTLADLEGLDPEYILPFAGSSDPLHRAVLAFTSKEKPFVTADPGYEAGERTAQFIGAKVRHTFT
jgi:histidinol-phosphate/aromatic aminotransferase/cobyric acid decarboxylase-like protein